MIRVVQVCEVMCISALMPYACSSEKTVHTALLVLSIAASAHACNWLEHDANGHLIQSCRVDRQVAAALAVACSPLGSETSFSSIGQHPSVTKWPNYVSLV
jgi:hypothetical protein